MHVTVFFILCNEIFKDDIRKKKYFLSPLMENGFYQSYKENKALQYLIVALEENIRFVNSFSK